MFGTKAELFREVFDRSSQAIQDTFNAEIDKLVVDAENEEFWNALGTAYGELIADRDLLLVMMHGFTAGSIEPDIAAQARTCMSEIYSLLRDRTGCTPERAREFIAQGMLLNTLLAMQAPEHAAEDPALEELSVCAFGSQLLAETQAAG